MPRTTHAIAALAALAAMLPTACGTSSEDDHDEAEIRATVQRYQERMSRLDGEAVCAMFTAETRASFDRTARDEGEADCAAGIRSLRDEFTKEELAAMPRVRVLGTTIAGDRATITRTQLDFPPVLEVISMPGALMKLRREHGRWLIEQAA